MGKLQNGISDLPFIHLTTGFGTSLLQTIELIEKILDQPVKYIEAPARTYDVHSFCGDPYRAKSLLGWEAQISLAQGISDLIKQYQTQFNYVMS
jgi:nucleoside-diphosphate-sugar epimerase